MPIYSKKIFVGVDTVDKSLYGEELARYKLDYLGGHENIDAILMNPDIRLDGC